jgi:hypothetical protein
MFALWMRSSGRKRHPDGLISSSVGLAARFIFDYELRQVIPLDYQLQSECESVDRLLLFPNGKFKAEHAALVKLTLDADVAVEFLQDAFHDRKPEAAPF